MPQRIVSLISSATEILYAIGLGDRVLAVSHECDYPDAVRKKPRVTFSHIGADQPSQVIDSQVKQLVSRGDPLYGVDADLLAQLKPDLIVTQAQCDVCAVRYEDVVATVESFEALRGTPIVSLNPLSLDEILVDIRRIGEATGAEQSADQFVGSLERRIGNVVKKTSSLSQSERPRVACIEWIEPVMFAANWIPRLIEMAGGKDGLSESGHHSEYGDWKTLVEYDPEIIIVMPCGFNLARTLEEANILRSFANWSSLSAVKSERVFAVDGNAYFNRSGPRIVDSLEILAHLFHPQFLKVPDSVRVPKAVWQRLLHNR